MAGFTTAFATVAIAGIGDKSFLTALALAACHKARWVFTGCIAALTFGTALWILIGAWMSTMIPVEAIKTVSGITFIFFGLKALSEAMSAKMRPKKIEPENSCHQKILNSHHPTSANAVIRNSFTTTFIAEFGDRTQLALLALAAGPNISAEDIFTGATAANSILLILAVTSGKFMKSWLCKKKILLISAGLFLILGTKILLFS
ncbi:TMEM165/GDT1 family protein [Synechococcus sp. MIT S1220]|uniref:TMEM165/GDT1 family protein n=1 Tax=Synechococcus sp. MIT S1220 TaxID=3082549 RepID=UPI0039AEDF5A